MLVILISFAFGFGLALARIGLPPMVGFLAAGFAYNLAGFTAPAGLDIVSDLGITLLLFSIGLKLDVRGLLKAEVWASATMQMVITTVVLSLVLFLGASLFSSELMTLSWDTVLILAFALSFSSTVFAVKVLEDKGDVYTLYGKIAIGILIMQDLLAVLFLSATGGKPPSLWALCLLALPLLRPLFFWILDMTGRGELFVLCGLFIALGAGAELFSLVGLKPDLGALVLGGLLAGYSRASELSGALFSFKELMLVGFFMSIGMTGLPTWEMLLVAALLCLALPLKTGIYHFILNIFGLRARTSLLASLTLTNFSEFGLIVVAISVSQGLLPQDWLMVSAMTVSLSFALSAPLSSRAEFLYQNILHFLCNFERKSCHPMELPIDFSTMKAVVVGMGRIGVGAYDELQEVYGNSICGVEHAPDRVNRNQEKGRNVILGDACDTEFWLKLKTDEHLEMIVLAMPRHQGNVYAAQQIRNMGIVCSVAAIAQFPEEIEELKATGVCSVFNLYEQAGAGLVHTALEGCKPGFTSSK